MNTLSPRRGSATAVLLLVAAIAAVSAGIYSSLRKAAPDRDVLGQLRQEAAR